MVSVFEISYIDMSYMNFIANKTDYKIKKIIENSFVIKTNIVRGEFIPNSYYDKQNAEVIKSKLEYINTIERSKNYPKSRLFKNNIPPKFSEIPGYGKGLLIDFTLEYLILNNIQIESKDQIDRYMLYYSQMTNDIGLLKTILYT